MNAYEFIIRKQIEWANNKGLDLIGSRGDRGRKDYTTHLEENLFQPLKENTRKELGAGNGGELSGRDGATPKIQALHSSSALGINVFDYWRGSTNLSIITASCGFSQEGHKLKGEIRFEQKYPIEARFLIPPNIDVIIIPQDNGRTKPFAIECKFTEAYSSRKHGGLDSKYFENDDIWQNLPKTKKLAHKIMDDDTHFNYLHAAQLVKHILGLNHTYGHSHYRLLYLWYDAIGEAGYKHRIEIEEFAKIVLSDGVVFHETTYQDLIIRLAKYRDSHSEYVSYLTGRYL